MKAALLFALLLLGCNPPPKSAFEKELREALARDVTIVQNTHSEYFNGDGEVVPGPPESDCHCCCCCKKGCK